MQALAFVAIAVVVALVLSRSLLHEVLSALRRRPSGPPSAVDSHSADGLRLSAPPSPMAFPLLVAADPTVSAVWVTTRDWPALGRFDVLTGEWRWTEFASFPHAATPDGRGGCWTALTRSSAVAHVDAHGDVRQVPVPKSRELLVSVLSHGSLWVVDAHRRVLLRIDEEFGAVDEVSLPADMLRPDFISAGPHHTLWVADTRTPHLAIVDQADADAPSVRLVEGPHRTRALLFDEERMGMWLGAADRSEITLVDSSGATLRSIVLPGIPFGICAVDDGRIAVAVKDSNVLCLVDPLTSGIDAIRLPDGSLPIGCAALGSRLFVTLSGLSQIAELTLDVRIAGNRPLSAELGVTALEGSPHLSI